VTNDIDILRERLDGALRHAEPTLTVPTKELTLLFQAYDAREASDDGV
jgi:hypothetical protein